MGRLRPHSAEWNEAMERICFLHAGGHKTGTTALQFYLHRNRGALLRAGYLVPKGGMSGTGAHHKLVRAIAGLAVPNDLQDCVQQLKKEASQTRARHLIVSSEFIERLMMLSDKTSTLIELFEQLGFRVHIVYYVRSQTQLLNSQYAQVSRSYALDLSFEDFIQRSIARKSRSFLAILSSMNSMKIDRTLRPYTDSVRKEGIVRDFLECIDLEGFSGGQELVRTNESIGPVAVQAARSSAAAIPGGVRTLGQLQAAKCTQALRAALKKRRLVEPAYCGLTTSLAERIGRTYEADNDAFANQVWGRSWRDVFAEDDARDYQPNDLNLVPPTARQKDELRALLAILEPRISEIARDEQFALKRGMNEQRSRHMRGMRASTTGRTAS